MGAIPTQPDSHFGYSDKDYAIFKHYAWRYLILFSLLYCCLYCARLNLSNAAALMIRDLQWTKADIGIVTGTLFWTYGFGQLVNGRLSEIVGPAKFVILAVFLSVLANICLSFQSSVLMIAIIWGLNGYFQSMAWTPGLATLTRWWPGNTRGFATGFANAFSGFGQVAATVSVALSFSLFPSMGWKAAFVFPVILPFAMLIVYILFAKTSPKAIGLAEYTENNEEKAKNEAEMTAITKTHGILYPYKYVLSDKRFRIWLVVALISGIARYGLVTWIPLYFIDKFNINITEGLLQSLALPVGMGIGTFIVPWLTDKYCPNNRLLAAVYSSIIGAIAITVFLFLDPTDTMQLVGIELLLFIAGFCIYAINGVAWAFATDLGGRIFSGTAAGTLNFTAYMGATIQSFLYGFLLDAGGWNIVFMSIAGFCLLVVGLGVIGSKKQA